MSDNDDRITRLEELVAHKGRVIEELSEQLVAQWKAAEQSRLKLDRLTERFLALEEQSLGPTPITRPPHY